jgi:hypothetical protein
MQRDFYLKKFVEAADLERVSLKRAHPLLKPVFQKRRPKNRCDVLGVEFHLLTWDHYDLSYLITPEQWLYEFWTIVQQGTRRNARKMLKELYRKIYVSGCVLPTLDRFDDFSISWRYDLWCLACVSVTDAWGLEAQATRNTFLCHSEGKTYGVDHANIVCYSRYNALPRCLHNTRARLAVNYTISDQFMLRLMSACKGTYLQEASKILAILDLTHKERDILEQGIRDEQKITSSVFNR